MVTAILIAWSVGLSMTIKCRPKAQFHIGSVAVVRALPSSLQKQQQTNKHIKQNHNKTYNSEEHWNWCKWPIPLAQWNVVSAWRAKLRHCHWHAANSKLRPTRGMRERSTCAWALSKGETCELCSSGPNWKRHNQHIKWNLQMSKLRGAGGRGHGLEKTMSTAERRN